MAWTAEKRGDFMKAVIFKLNKKYSVALTPEGDFVRVKGTGYAVGQEIELSDGRQRPAQGHSRIGVLRLACVCAAVLILAAAAVFGGLWYGENRVTYYTAEIDINPEVKLFVNKKDIVYKAQALNADAETLNPSGLTGKNIDEFIKAYLAACKDRGFIGETDEALIALYVKAEKAGVNAELKTEALRKTVTEACEDLNVTVTFEAEEEPGGNNKDYTVVFMIKTTLEDGYQPFGYNVEIAEGGIPAKPDNPDNNGGLIFRFWSLDKNAAAAETQKDYFTAANGLYGLGAAHADENGRIFMYAVYSYTPPPDVKYTVKFRVKNAEGDYVSLGEAHNQVIIGVQKADKPHTDEATAAAIAFWSLNRNAVAANTSEDYFQNPLSALEISGLGITGADGVVYLYAVYTSAPQPAKFTVIFMVKNAEGNYAAYGDSFNKEINEGGKPDKPTNPGNIGDKTFCFWSLEKDAPAAETGKNYFAEATGLYPLGSADADESGRIFFYAIYSS